MNQISVYLSKFKNLGLEENLIKNQVLEVFNNKFSFDLKREQVEYKNGNLKINISGPQKTEIVLKKEEIVKVLNKEFEKINTKIFKLN